MDIKDLYLDAQSDEAKLIYSIGFLWNEISISLNNTLSKVNLNMAKFNILMVIKHVGLKTGIQQNEISSRLLVTASNITKMLDKLEAEGLITRNDKKGNRRVKIIKITKKGSDLLDAIWKDYSNTIENLSPKITTVKKEKLIKVLENWKNNVSKCNNLR